MERFAVRAGQVFDGEQALGPATVVVQDRRVVEVTRSAVPGAEDLGDDVTLLPGLVDGHLHLAFDGSPDVVASMAVDDDALLDRMRASVDRMLAAGVTTARDLGDRGFLARGLADELADRPTLLAAGPPLTSPLGHCHFLGGEVADLPAMLRAVGERAARGCHTVKVMVSGGNITPGSTPLDTQFDVADLREVVAEAHRLGLLTAAHVHAAASARAAVDAGFDSLEHATLMTADGVDSDPELLRRIAGEGIVVSATPGARPGAALPPALATRVALIMDNLLTLHDLGARTVLASDGGVALEKSHDALPHGALVAQAAGIPAADVLRMVTSRAADALGLGGRKGSLRPGVDADVLAVRGDPTRDVAALQDVVEVCVGGRSAVRPRR